MSNTALANKNNGSTDITPIERALVMGDLSQLTQEQRFDYYNSICQSLQLNPLTKPFDYITLNGKLTLYAKKDAADQLRKLHSVSITDLKGETINDVYRVTAFASMPSGRTDTSTGAVSIAGLKGDALANAIMKCETKAKRRVTLSICGLGVLDETELETTYAYAPPPPRITATTAPPAAHDPDTGEIAEPPPAQFSKPANKPRATAAQVDELIALGEQLGYDRTFLREQLGVTNLNELSAERCDKAIARLKELIAQDEAQAQAKQQATDEGGPAVVIADLNNASWQHEQYAKEPPAPTQDDFDSLPHGGGATATEKQVKAIYAIGRAAKKYTPTQVEERCTEVFGVRPSELTKAEASQFIDMMKGEAAQ